MDEKEQISEMMRRTRALLDQICAEPPRTAVDVKAREVLSLARSAMQTDGAFLEACDACMAELGAIESPDGSRLSQPYEDALTAFAAEMHAVVRTVVGGEPPVSA